MRKSWRPVAFGSLFITSISDICDVRQKSRGLPSPGAPRNPKERYGTENGGITNRIRNFRDSWISLFSFIRHPSAVGSSIYHFRVGCWALKGTPRNAHRNPTEPHGTLRNGKLFELRIESGILRVPGSAFCFLSSPPIYGGFVYLSFPRWALGVNGHARGTPPGNPRTPLNAAGR